MSETQSSGDVDKVFFELSKKKLKEQYVREFGPVEFKTADCGKEGDIAGQLSITYPDRIFGMDDEGVDMFLTLMRDFIGLVIGCQDFAEFAIPVVYKLVVEGGMAIVSQAMEDAAEEEDSGTDPTRNPELN